MKLKHVVLGILIAGTLVAPSLAAAQQPGKIAVGYLGTGAPPTLNTPNAGLEAFRQGLAALGYVEGQGVGIETRTGSQIGWRELIRRNPRQPPRSWQAPRPE
jgi:hypothetical protein